MKNQFARRGYGQAAALPQQRCERVAAPRPSAVIARRHIAAHPLSEQRFIGAYLALFLSATQEDGSKTVTIARFGAYEVRLIEFADGPCPDVPLLWLELYRHDTRIGLDSFRCEDFDDAVVAADLFTARAKTLHEQAGSSPREKLARDIVEKLREAGFACNVLATDEE